MLKEGTLLSHLPTKDRIEKINKQTYTNTRQGLHYKAKNE